MLSPRPSHEQTAERSPDDDHQEHDNQCRTRKPEQHNSLRNQTTTGPADSVTSTIRDLGKLPAAQTGAAHSQGRTGHRAAACQGTEWAPGSCGPFRRRWTNSAIEIPIKMTPPSTPPTDAQTTLIGRAWVHGCDSDHTPKTMPRDAARKTHPMTTAKCGSARRLAPSDTRQRLQSKPPRRPLSGRPLRPLWACEQPGQRQVSATPREHFAFRCPTSGAARACPSSACAFVGCPEREFCWQPVVSAARSS